jgi:protein-S-isoprenylcysteine O-methyltransferase Ste14
MMTWPMRIILIVVSSVVWFGLAVVGRGGPGAFFALPPLIALTAVTVLMVIAALFAGGNISSGEREDRGNRWVLAAFGILGLLLGFCPAWDDRVGFWTFDGDVVRWCGVVAFAMGGVLRLWPVFVLGNRFSGLVAIQPGHALETRGIYRYIRNPSYLGAILVTLGWSLAFRSGIGLVLSALMLPPLVARIDAEETLLRSQFGAEYEAYRARTWRLVPGIW